MGSRFVPTVLRLVALALCAAVLSSCAGPSRWAGFNGWVTPVAGDLSGETDFRVRVCAPDCKEADVKTTPSAQGAGIAVADFDEWRTGVPVRISVSLLRKNGRIVIPEQALEITPKTSRDPSRSSVGSAILDAQQKSVAPGELSLPEYKTPSPT